MSNTADRVEVVDEIKPDNNHDYIIAKHKYSAYIYTVTLVVNGLNNNS